MYKSFSVGDKVTLTESARRQNVAPEKYQIGVITAVGSWNIDDVKWNGIDRPIGMRGDEIQGVQE